MTRFLTIASCFAFAVASAQVRAVPVTFDDVNAFRAFNEADGKELKGIETFEEAVIDSGQKITLYDPLTSGVPNPPGSPQGFPNGIAEGNLIIQSNITPGPTPPAPNPDPGNPLALYVIGPGFIDSNSVKVGEDQFLNGVWASVDLIFTEPNHTGVGFWLSRFRDFPNGGWTISVYDKNDMVLGVFGVPAPTGPEPNKVFWGVWADPSIGRINIFDNAGPAPDAIDDIEMWVPEPATLLLLAGGAGLILRQRRWGG